MTRRYPRTPFETTGPTRTKQAFKAECDVNTIMRRFQETGVMDHVNRYPAGYGDLTNVPSFHEAQNKVARANEMFASIPAAIRKRFGNDPGAYLEFVTDPRNQDELIKMGLARRIEQPEAPAEPDPPTGGD